MVAQGPDSILCTEKTKGADTGTPLFSEARVEEPSILQSDLGKPELLSGCGLGPIRLSLQGV